MIHHDQAKGSCPLYLGSHQRVAENYEAQSRCVLNQQKVIEKLLRTFEDEGLGDPLLPGKLSAASLDPNGLSTSQSICQISPNSIPITWDGRAKDLKQTAMKGKKYGALVLTEEMIQKWNAYFNT